MFFLTTFFIIIAIHGAALGNKLHDAIKTSDVGEVAKVLKEAEDGGNLYSIMREHDEKDRFGKAFPLGHVYTYMTYYERIVELLLKAGSSLESGKRETTLELAKHLRDCVFFDDDNKLVNAITWCRIDVLHIALREAENEDNLDSILQHVDERTNLNPLGYAYAHLMGLEMMLKMLLEAGSPVSSPEGQSTLHYATSLKDRNKYRSLQDCNGYDEMLKYAKPEDLETISEYRLYYPTRECKGTVLDIAVAINDESRVEKILERGANPNAVIESETVMHRAVRVGNLAIFKLLVKYGGKADGKGADGMTPLMTAAEFMENDILDWLVDELRVDVNAVTAETQYTAMHFAVEVGNVDGVKKLLSIDASSRNIKNAAGVTPSEMAADSGNEEISKLLSDSVA